MKCLKTALYCALLLFSASTATFQHHITNKTFETLELYPVADPYREGYLPVSDIHTLYYAEFGNPDGLPVVVLHGGPGVGCHPSLTATFDLSYYRVIMFDQRGAMRSLPFAEMRDNQSDYLVEDIETLRKHLGIDKWLVFGGSWGSTLAILYGQTHPDHVLGFVLRGIFLARKKDYEHLFYGVKQFFPEIWQSMVEPFSPEEREDLITSFYDRIMNSDPSIHMPLAHSFMRYDTIAGTAQANPDLIGNLNDTEALSIARAFVHYASNNFFLTDNQLLNNISNIEHLPVIIVQGRYDMICPPEQAYELYSKWNNALLWFITEGGHFYSDPSIARGLREALDIMRALF